MNTTTTYAGGTAANYQVIVDASEAVLSDAQSRLPEGVIAREEALVNDLETDTHRLTCSDTTSQYINTINMWLVSGTDEIAIIDGLRAEYEGEGWTRAPGVAEQSGQDQDPTGRYIQTLRSPDGFTLSIRRGDDTDGTVILQFAVYSPCIENPADKPTTWGK